MSRVFMNAAEKVSQNLLQVQTAIAKACQKSGRNEQSVQLLAVTKYASDEDVLALLSTGKLLISAKAAYSRPPPVGKTRLLLSFPFINTLSGICKKTKPHKRWNSLTLLIL